MVGTPEIFVLRYFYMEELIMTQIRAHYTSNNPEVHSIDPAQLHDVDVQLNELGELVIELEVEESPPEYPHWTLNRFYEI